MTKLKKYLKDHDIQQKWLANQIGYTEAAISQVCSGSKRGGIAIWMAIAKVLSVDLNEITGETDND